jgi:glutamine synthetase
MDSKDLLKRIKEDGVKFVSLQFTDVTGTVKSVDMPISASKARWRTVCGSTVPRSRALPASRNRTCG